MNPSTICTMAGMTGAGLLGLFLAARAVDPGMQIFGLVLAALAVLLNFWLIHRYYDPAVSAAENAD